MNNSYQLGPIAISKSFVHNPLFIPGLIAVVLLGGVYFAYSAGLIPFSTQPPKPTLKAQIFPLNQQLSKPVIYSSGTTIYRTNGQVEEKLFEVGSEVLSLTLSNDGTRLAATYKHTNGGSNASGYPYTSLIFYDMNTRRSLPIIAQVNTTVRYPQWSDDGRYLSFWVNDGDESFIYDTTRRKATFSVKREQSSAVSPIMFLPNNAGITYIKNGTVFTAANDGTRPIALAEKAASTRSTSTGTVANLPLVSPNSEYIAYYTFNNELTVVNTATREIKTVGQDLTNLGFLNNQELLYATQSNEPKEKSTISYFVIPDSKSHPLSNWKSFLSKDGMPEAAVVLSKSGSFLLPSIHPNVGPQLIEQDSTVKQDCSVAEFQYSYKVDHNDTSAPESILVVSPDEKYVLGKSNGSLAVLDSETCQPYIIAQTNPTAMTWTP